MQQALYLRRLRDFGEKISDSFLFLKQNWKTLFSIYAVFVVPILLVAVIMVLSLAGHIYTDRLSSAESFQFSDLLTGEFYIIMLCLLLAGSSYNTAVYSYFRIYDEQKGEKPTLGQVGQLFFAKFFKVFLYNIVVTLLLFVIAIIPMVIVMFIPVLNFFAVIFFVMLFMVILFYLNCIFVTEDFGLSGGVSHLFYLFNGRWWQTIWFTFIVFLIYFVFSFVLQFALSLVSEAFSISFFSPRVSHLGNSGHNMLTITVLLLGILYIVQQLFYLIVFCAVGVNYYSLAEEKDGSSLEAQIENIGASADKYDGVEEQY